LWRSVKWRRRLGVQTNSEKLSLGLVSLELLDGCTEKRWPSFIL
jgi:hypothetical protein